MLNAFRSALRSYRELILAGTFAVMATWEVLEILLLERAYRASMPVTLLIHSLQVLLIVAATGIALRAWREKTARQRALASLVEQVIAAQEDERRRVAYDVHDGVAQLVVSAKQHLDTATDLWSRDTRRAASETAIAADRLGRAIAETRRILAALRPLAVDAGGLADAARQSLDEVARDTGWSVEPRREPRRGAPAAGGRDGGAQDSPGGAVERAQARRHHPDRSGPLTGHRPHPSRRA